MLTPLDPCGPAAWELGKVLSSTGSFHRRDALLRMARRCSWPPKLLSQSWSGSQPWPPAPGREPGTLTRILLASRFLPTKGTRLWKWWGWWLSKNRMAWAGWRWTAWRQGTGAPVNTLVLLEPPFSPRAWLGEHLTWAVIVKVPISFGRERNHCLCNSLQIISACEGFFKKWVRFNQNEELK